MAPYDMKDESRHYWHVMETRLRRIVCTMLVDSMMQTKPGCKDLSRHSRTDRHEYLLQCSVQGSQEDNE